MARGRKRRDTSKQQGGFTRDLFTQFVDDARAQKSDLDEARGTLGNIFKQVEEHGGNRKAMRDAMRLADMEVSKRNDYLRDLQLYCDWLGVWDQGGLWEEPGVPHPPEHAETREESEAGEGEENQGEENTAAAAYEAGLAAGRAGRDPEQGPYEDDEAARQEYYRGWLAGQRELAGDPEPEPPEWAKEPCDPPPPRRGRQTRRPRGTLGAPRGGRTTTGAPPRRGRRGADDGVIRDAAE